MTKAVLQNEKYVIEHDLGKLEFDFKKKKYFDSFKQIIDTYTTNHNISRNYLWFLFKEIIESGFLQDPQFENEEAKIKYALRLFSTRMNKEYPCPCCQGKLGE